VLVEEVVVIRAETLVRVYSVYRLWE
jgi:hypothetical protein